MNKSILNPEAKSFEFEIHPISRDFNEFFLTLFTDWGSENVDSIVSRLEAVKTLGTAQLLFEELFKVIYNLTKQSAIQVKVDNIVIAINILDDQLPQIIIDNSDDPATSVMNSYMEIRKQSFETCFKRIFHSFDLVVEANSVSLLQELEGVLLVLAKISRIKNYQDYVELFVKYLWEIYNRHRNNEDIVVCILQTLSLTAYRLLSFLLISVEKIKEQRKKDKQLAYIAIEIFTILKVELINKRFTRPMIVHVLHMLDQRDRFIGRFVDAVPENVLHTRGFILCSSQTVTIEPDEVYEDYEDFINNS